LPRDRTGDLVNSGEVTPDELVEYRPPIIDTFPANPYTWDEIIALHRQRNASRWPLRSSFNSEMFLMLDRPKFALVADDEPVAAAPRKAEPYDARELRVRAVAAIEGVDHRASVTVNVNQQTNVAAITPGSVIRLPAKAGDALPAIGQEREPLTIDQGA
jgi:hypothetical protein